MTVSSRTAMTSGVAVAATLLLTITGCGLLTSQGPSPSRVAHTNPATTY